VYFDDAAKANEIDIKKCKSLLILNELKEKLATSMQKTLYFISIE
jgi:hypothetical protein